MKKIGLLFVLIVFSVSMVWGADHWTESFENPDSWSGYTTGTVTFDSGDWDFVSVLDEYSTASYDGDNAARINDDVSGASITAPAVNSVGTVTFYYHRPYGGTGTLSLQKSVGGGSYTELTTQNFDDVTSPTLFSYDVNDTNDNIRIRIVNNDNTAHLTIDYMTLTDYAGGVDPEPTNHASSFIATTTSSSQIDLTWNDNDGSQPADRFLIKASDTDYSSITAPSDGSEEADDTDLSDGSGAVNVLHGIESYSWTSLSAETTYYFKIWPYTNSGADIDYKLDGSIPQDQATTGSEPVAPTASAVYISEVSDDDTGGFDTAYMEIYNNSSDILDMENSYIERWEAGAYDNYTYTFGSGVEIPANGLLIVARGAVESTFETDWSIDFTSLNAIYDSGNNNLYFTTGRSYKLFSPAKAELDVTPSVSSGNRITQSSIGTWSSEESSSNATPGELDSGQTLPVVLSTFTATFSDNKPLIQWTTATQTDVQGFNVFRSENQDLSEVGDHINVSIIPGEGTTTEPHDYSFVDEVANPFKPYYYWLQVVDFGGECQYHGPQKYTPGDIDGDNQIDSYSVNKLFPSKPNPCSQQVSIDYKLKGSVLNQRAEIVIYNIRGQIIMRVQGTQGNATIDVSDLKTGVYFYQLKETGFNQIKKMVIID